MPDNAFNAAFNLGNNQFAKDCGEPFQIIPTTGTQKGIPGTYTANSIDDLTSGVVGAPGGAVQQNAVHIFVSKALMASAKIVDGTVMIVRNKKVRLKDVSDAGDNKVMLVCEKVSLVAQVT